MRIESTTSWGVRSRTLRCTIPAHHPGALDPVRRIELRNTSSAAGSGSPLKATVVINTYGERQSESVAPLAGNFPRAAWEHGHVQFAEWLEGANRRQVRTLKARPIDLVDADRAAMLALPPIPPSVGWVNQIRLGRDYYVRVDSSNYSVDPSVIGRQVTVTADLEGVTVRHDRRLVADHARVWARQVTVTDAAHAATALQLRERLAEPRRVDDAGLLRDLTDNDRAFGLDGQVA